MSVYYVNCSGNAGMKEKEFDSLSEANDYYLKCKEEKEWNHIELTKQLKPIYLIQMKILHKTIF
ncbi:hypothetical protein [Niallia circulans]|uniref:hypothetical protein n=1 Tax=Niallia circulans TaxID=1397 RepID=UPI0026EE87DA|nr:hypothetical protein [Niallia circulans]